MRDRTRVYTPAGLAAASAGVFVWGIGAVLVKLTTTPWPVLTFYKLLFSIPLLALAWVVAGRTPLPWKAAGIGGLLFAAHQLAHFSSLRYSTAAVVTILFSLQPVLVGAAGKRVTGEVATRAFYGWSLVAVAGCAILVFAAHNQPNATPLGTFLAVLNLIAWSAYYLATKRARTDYGTMAWLLVMSVVSLLCVGAVAVIARQPFGSPSVHDWWTIAAIAVFPGTLGHALVTWAHPRIHAAASSVVVLGVPVVASIGAAIFAHEPFGPGQALGALVALGGAAMAMRRLAPTLTEEAAETYGEVAS